MPESTVGGGDLDAEAANDQCQSGDAMKVRPGDVVRIRDLHTVEGKPIRVPDTAGLTHLQFRRFAGCPICSLHLTIDDGPQR